MKTPEHRVEKLLRSLGGNVYFGVDDDGTVKGLDVGKQTLMDIRTRVKELIDPSIICDIKELKDEAGRSYIHIHAEGTDIPYSCDGRYFIRNVSSDEKVGRDLLRKMLVSGSTDILRQISSERQDLTFKGMNEVLSNKGVHASGSSEFLSDFGLTNEDGRFNLLAYLLSDQNDLVIKVMRFAGLDKTVMEERMEFKGQSLLVTARQVLDYFKLINLPKKINLSTGIRSETSLFDDQSFHEAWINACVHNTWVEKIPPSVYLYDDRLEVVSYGGLPYGLSKEGFYAQHQLASQPPPL